MFQLPQFFLGTISHPHSAIALTSHHLLFTLGIHNKRAATNRISRSTQHNQCLGCIHFLFSFLFHHKASCDYSDSNISSLRWFLHCQAWNNSHLGLHNGAEGSGSFTAPRSDKHTSSEQEILYSIWSRCDFFIMRPRSFVLDTDAEHGTWIKCTFCWTEHQKTACWVLGI